MWQMIVRVGGTLLKAVPCFYVDRRACDRIGRI